jgi:hypothetical protein
MVLHLGAGKKARDMPTQIAEKFHQYLLLFLG